ncbi:MAG: DEAD/DEAH box helicase, partial [Planctomycetes bacterium]|nr:DEAD/DEAH box helicase [Planctomycetota bacterium]
ILEFYLRESNKTEYIELIPDIGMWLEFGASLSTQLSLMGLGLSRTAAIIVSEFIAEDDFSEDDVIDWLRRELDSLDVSPIIKREIHEAIGSRL